MHIMHAPGAGGTQIWFGRESAARALKPLPMFKGHFGRKRYPFLGIFLEILAHFSNFSGVCHANTRKF